jgi:isoaspartyl peptidase/L-asparaginase-like protein (Ntn-hydrolase superfamily)
LIPAAAPGSLVVMAGSGTTIGTVVRWDADRGGAVIEAPEIPGGCWADRSVVVHSTTGAGELRAGQVVAFEWTEPGAHGLPFRAVRVTPREDLQSTVGG